LHRFCDLLARAQAQVSTAPAAAIESAGLAEKALPGRAGPAVIVARASLALGKLDDAAREFDRARAIDPRSVEDPSTMYDLARVLRRTGKLGEALTVYRALVPRIDLLPHADRRVSVLLEAAHVSMAAEALPHGDAPARPRLDEAIAYLREARQRPPTQLSGDVLLSLALVLDRAGDKVQADAALGDAHRMGAELRPGDGAGNPPVGTAAVLEYLGVTADQSALQALSLEATDRPRAIKSWETFLASQGAGSPWVAAARMRLDQLRKSPAKPGKTPRTPSRVP
jgi:tetratricopeptide (TPR) repeat protein